MTLTQDDLHALCSLAVIAASKAACLISETAPESLSVERKDAAVSLASEVVSQLDRDAQVLILELLQESLTQYDLGMLAEESEDSQDRFDKDYFWCIDPLDGTLPFLEGNPGYAVSIALISREGVPVIGVVEDPLTGKRYQAIRDAGAQVNEQTFKVESERGVLNVFTDRSMEKHPLFSACMKALGPVHIHPPAGAVMNVCNLLQQAPACYFKFPKPEKGGGSLWDYAATACITREAGAVVTDLEGSPLDLNRKDSTFMNHRGFLYASNPELHVHVGKIVRSQWDGCRKGKLES